MSENENIKTQIALAPIKSDMQYLHDKMIALETKIDKLEKLEEQHVISWGRLTEESKEQRRRLEIAEEIISDLCRKLGEITPPQGE